MPGVLFVLAVGDGGFRQRGRQVIAGFDDLTQLRFTAFKPRVLLRFATSPIPAQPLPHRRGQLSGDRSIDLLDRPKDPLHGVAFISLGGAITGAQRRHHARQFAAVDADAVKHIEQFRQAIEVALLPTASDRSRRPRAATEGVEPDVVVYYRLLSPSLHAIDPQVQEFGGQFGAHCRLAFDSLSQQLQG